MAQRLVADGQRVPFLGLIDSYGGKYPKVIRPLSPRKRLRILIARLIPLKENERLSQSHYKAAVRVALRLKPRLWLVRLLTRFPFLPRIYALRHECLRETCFAARRKYPLREFPGKLHLFRTEENLLPRDLFEDDPERGWHGSAADGIEIYAIPGHHGNHLEEPLVGILAAKLAAALEQARSSGQP